MEERLRVAEERVEQLFALLNDMQWYGDFCEECGKLVHRILTCPSCNRPVCSQCDSHGCDTSEEPVQESGE